MLKKLFGKNITEESFVSPVNGRVVPLEEVPDPVFAEKMMGDGIAIEPTDETIVRPIDAEIVQVFRNKACHRLENNKWDLNCFSTSVWILSI